MHWTQRGLTLLELILVQAVFILTGIALRTWHNARVYGRRCDRGDWNEGWIVYIDRNLNYRRQPGEALSRVHAELSGQAHLSRNHLIVHRVGFLRSGLMDGVQNGTITYRACPPAPELHHCLIMARRGRIRTANGKHCH